MAAMVGTDDSLYQRPTEAPARVGVAVASVGVSLPETVVLNAPIAARLGVSDDWIVR